jgi:hypothetical protein
MKTTFVSFLLALTIGALPVLAQPTFLWSKVGIGPTLDEARSIALLPSGDILMSGVFRDSIVFGNHTVPVVGRSYDAFVMRFGRTGNVQSSVAFGGLYEDDVRNIAVDKDGNYYVGFSFSEQIQIGGDVFDGVDGEASNDIALVKFNRMGIRQWVRIFGSPEGDEEAPFIACDSVGNVYLAVAFANEAQFGQRKVISSGNLDVAVVKINGTTGDVVWAKNGGGTEGDIPSGIAVTPNGDRVYVAGTFRGLGRWAFEQIESVNNLADFFILAYTSNGDVSFLKRAGYPGTDRHIRCAVDRNGEMILTGAINGTTLFAGTSISATGENASDVFFARFSKSGDLKTLVKFGSTFEETGLALATDSKNNVYIGGRFDSLTVFGPSSLVSHGGLDGFILRLRENGTYDWARRLGGQFNDEVSGILVNGNNEPIVCGTFTTEVTIGDASFAGDRLTDIFLATMECGPNTELLPSSGPLRICAGSDSLLSAYPGYPNYQWSVNGTSSPTMGHRFSLGELPVGNHAVNVRITDQLDCMLTSVTVNVEIYEGMEQPVLTRDGDVLRVNLTGKQYEWWREARRINDANSHELNVQGQGLYAVRVTDDDGCSRTATILVGTTSVEEIAQHGLRLYPNPTAGDVILEGAPVGASIMLFDILGNRLASVVAGEDATTISMLNLPRGVYTMVVAGNGINVSRKVARW